MDPSLTNLIKRMRCSSYDTERAEANKFRQIGTICIRDQYLGRKVSERDWDASRLAGKKEDFFYVTMHIRLKSSQSCNRISRITTASRLKCPKIGEMTATVGITPYWQWGENKLISIGSGIVRLSCYRLSVHDCWWHRVAKQTTKATIRDERDLPWWITQRST